MDYIPIAEPVPSDEEPDPDAPLAVVVQAPEEEKKEEEKKEEEEEEEEEGEGALPRQEGGVRRKTRRKKKKRKSRKKKRKSRRKTRKKRRRKSRKKRKTRRRKKGGVKTAFKKTLKKSPRVLDLQTLTQPKHAKLNIVRGFKQSKPSSLSKQQTVMFRPISPQSQPPSIIQPSQGLVEQSLEDELASMTISDSSNTDSNQ